MTAIGFTMYAGDSKVVEVTVRDADGEVVDITGSSVRWHVARSAFDAAVIEKSSDTGGGIEMVSPNTGRFDIEIEPEDTEDLLGDYYHEAEVIDEAGMVATVISGIVQIKVALIGA